MAPGGLSCPVTNGDKMKVARLAAAALVALSPLTFAVAQDRQFSPAAARAYTSLVYYHLQHYKRYPNSARGASGTVVVTFVLDREGNVASSAVERSSGNEALDREALTILQRAKPFPRFPASESGSQVRFNAPITFLRSKRKATGQKKLSHVPIGGGLTQLVQR